MFCHRTWKNDILDEYFITWQSYTTFFNQKKAEDRCFGFKKNNKTNKAL